MNKLTDAASTDDSAAAADTQLVAQEQKQARLDALASSLSKKRTAAVNHRRSTGIEDIWREDEEYYEGVDAANRGETVTLKPRDSTGTGGTSVADSADVGTGSTVFLNITRPYVDFSAGRAADMLLPTDDRNWDLRPTPMPDVIKAMNSTEPLPEPKGDITTYGQAAQAMVEEAHAKVDKARTRIEDWHEEGQFHAEQRKILRDSSKVGVGILKGPFPVKRMARAISHDEQTGQVSLQIQNKTAPVSKCISYWNFYPDPSCGDNIHNGSYVWEKDSITARQLRDLMDTADADGNPMYIESAIEQCLKEGAQRKFEDDPQYYAPDTESYEIWYFNGVASAEDLAAAGVVVDEGSVVPCTITMVNDRVIKAALTTLDSGTFPYDVMVWQPREHHWAGIGVARQVRAPQRMINAGVRNLMDNAGMGAGPMTVIAKGAIKPLGKGAKYGIAPRKMWEFDPSAGLDDVRKAIASIEIPMLSAELLSIIQFALKMAEDVTGLPMLMQGQQGQASHTVGGMQLLTNNSNTPMRAIAKLYDDRITEPHLLRYYEWLLLYGPEEDEKGEYIVAARGSSALFERDAQNQAIMQMAPLVGNPAFKINPEKWLTESLKAQRLDPTRFQYSETEWAQLQKQMQANPPPADPRLEAAKIAADASIKRAEMTVEVQKEKIARDADRDAVFAQAESERTRVSHEAQMEEMQLRERLAIMEYANREKVTIDQIKAGLASDAMKLKVQRELSMLTAGGKGPTAQTSTPPSEPAGQAPKGDGYQA